ncbi:Wall-associated receptor kinase [Parasponia andersonii]|uniref:Wall-associated receptor kinase n=1 Tax=Parasponia andersonii TaxID=3476 RepID=A0A2P5C5W9_PARAD|nr:Wall-associated receptor kinase [Parasponia andersonii]
MAQHIVLFQILLFSWLVVSGAQTIAKQNCPAQCGNVTIPYPFGIGTGCFLDEWFEVVCASGTTPSLNGTNGLVVTEINMDGTLLVRNYWSGAETQESLGLKGGPFELPNLVNVVLKWELLNHSTLDVFGTFFEPNKSNDMRRNYFDTETNEYVAGLRSMNSSCELYYLDNRTTAASSLDRSTRLQCWCPPGYEGNPYLIEGCHDIDECVTNSTAARTCSNIEGAICLNVPGGFLCSLTDRKNTSRVKPILIGVGSGLGALFLIVGSWVLFKVIQRRKEIQRKKKFFERNGGLSFQQQLSSNQVNVEKTMLFKSEELEKATDRFNVNRILGQGGQGTVYKGMVADGKIVAIKKSKILDQEKLKEFINEVVILSQINHRNVVKLLGCCLETEVPLLVYEFIPNGTLSHYIHDPNEEIPLTWGMRLRIATEIAGALSYLHSSASSPIYHRDIKSTNILLDQKHRAKIADFGTSRSVSIDQTHLTTLVYGTFGYLDPEYFQSSQFTDKSDVYSFGVVLVELLTGQKPISTTRSNEGRSLSTYFLHCMEENRLFDIVDARVKKEGENGAIMELANVARRCLNLSGKKRPTMREVSTVLEGIQKSVLKASSDQQNFEVVEYVHDEVSEPELFEIFNTTSTWSGSNGAASSSSGLPFQSP